MASAHDVAIQKTPKGVKVELGKLYVYPDGHANLTFPAVPDQGQPDLNLPLTDTTDVLLELTTLVQRMKEEIVKSRPGQP